MAVGPQPVLKEQRVILEPIPVAVITSGTQILRKIKDRSSLG